MQISPVICFVSANAKPVLLFLSGSGVSVGTMMSADVPLGRFVVWVIVEGDTGRGVVVTAVVSIAVVTGGLPCGVVSVVPLGRTELIVGAGFCFVERTFALWAHMCPIVNAR